MKCPVCERDAPGQARFCDRCGAVLDPFLEPDAPRAGTAGGGGAPRSELDSVQGETDPLPLPETLFAGRYRITRELGRGGFGVVWEAEDVSEKGRPVAVKRLLPSRLALPAARKRLEEEAEILSSLRHPGVVRLRAWGEAEESPYLVMERLEGRSLRSWIEERKASPKRDRLEPVLPLAFQLVETLCATHARTAHLDLKPENVMLLEDGTAVVLDFGLAKVADFRAQGRRLLGTAYYVAPEILEGRDVVGFRADVFSVGVMLYEMASGELPVGVYPPLARILSDAPDDLDRLLRKAMEPNPVHRFRNLFEVRAALGACFPDVRPPEEDLALARRRTAGADPSANLWLAVLLEARGETASAQEQYKIASARARGTPVEEMAREALGYPRRRTLRYCILCGVGLPPGARRTSLCSACRKGERKRRPAAASTEETPAPLIRGPVGGAAFLRFSPDGKECLAAGEFGDAVILSRREGGGWRAALRLAIPRGVLDADFLGGPGRSILLASRLGAFAGWSRRPVVPLPGFEPPEADASPHPAGAVFLASTRAWIGDSAGRIFEVDLEKECLREKRCALEGKILALGRAGPGRVLAVTAEGDWGLATDGEEGWTATGTLSGGRPRRAAVASRAPVFIAVSGRKLVRVKATDQEVVETPVPSGVPALAVEAGGRWIAAGDEQGRVVLLGEEGREHPAWRLDDNLVCGLAVSPDGKWIAASTLGGGVWMLRT